MNWLVCVPVVHNDVTLTVYVYNVFVLVIKIFHIDPGREHLIYSAL